MDGYTTEDLLHLGGAALIVACIFIYKIRQYLGLKGLKNMEKRMGIVFELSAYSLLLSMIVLLSWGAHLATVESAKYITEEKAYIDKEYLKIGDKVNITYRLKANRDLKIYGFNASVELHEIARRANRHKDFLVGKIDGTHLIKKGESKNFTLPFTIPISRWHDSWVLIVNYNFIDVKNNESGPHSRHFNFDVHKF